MKGLRTRQGDLWSVENIKWCAQRSDINRVRHIGCDIPGHANYRCGCHHMTTGPNGFRYTLCAAAMALLPVPAGSPAGHVGYIKVDDRIDQAERLGHIHRCGGKIYSLKRIEGRPANEFYPTTAAQRVPENTPCSCGRIKTHVTGYTPAAVVISPTYGLLSGGVNTYRIFYTS